VPFLYSCFRLRKEFSLSSSITMCASSEYLSNGIYRGACVPDQGFRDASGAGKILTLECRRAGYRCFFRNLF
jgi:hypothetical protein